MESMGLEASERTERMVRVVCFRAVRSVIVFSWEDVCIIRELNALAM